MFPIPDVFRDITPTPQRYVRLADKSQIAIIGEGDTCLVSSAFYVPELDCGIISVPTLDHQGYVITFNNGECIVELDSIIVMVGHYNSQYWPIQP
jgi:hypothetical protein